MEGGDVILSLAEPEGAAGWQDMYPAYLLLDPTAADLPYWIYDGLHHPGVKAPFDTIVNEAIRLSKGQWTGRVFALPGGYGTEYRILNGHVYIAPVPVQDSAEREARAAVFAERSRYYYDRWDAMYKRWLGRVCAIIAETELVDVPSLPGTEAPEVLYDGAPAASGMRLLRAYDVLQDQIMNIWQHHFEMLTLGYAAYFDLYQVARSCFPGITDSAISGLLSGHQSATTRAAAVVNELATYAEEHGMADFVLATPYSMAASTLDTDDAGRTLRRMWDDLGDPWFNITTEGGLSHRSVSWRDDPSIVWGSIQQQLRLKAGTSPAMPYRRTSDPERLSATYAAMISDAGTRARFQDSVRLARTVMAFVEDHSFYVENWFHGVFWRKMRSIAGVLAAAGFVDAPNHLFRLNRWEVGQALYDAVACWGNRTHSLIAHQIRHTAIARGPLLAALGRWEPIPELGSSPVTGGDPVMRMLFGVSSREAAGQSPSQSPSEFSGHGASSGKVVGPVRIVTSDADLASVRRGDVVVAHTASIAWTATFGIIGALVTELGGVMSHVAIVAREFQLPAVLGVRGATTRLGNGQLVEVDGESGIVAVVDR